MLTIGISESSRLSDSSSLMAPVTQSLGIVWVVLVVAAGMIGNVGTKASLEMLADADSANDSTAVSDAAISLWIVTRTLHTSLGGGNEIIGGLWVLFVSWSNYPSLRNPRRDVNCDSSSQTTATTYKNLLFYKIECMIGICSGVVGVVSTVPILSDAGAAFGVLMILWYMMLGIRYTCLVRASTYF